MGVWELANNFRMMKLAVPKTKGNWTSWHSLALEHPSAICHGSKGLLMRNQGSASSTDRDSGKILAPCQSKRGFTNSLTYQSLNLLRKVAEWTWAFHHKYLTGFWLWGWNGGQRNDISRFGSPGGRKTGDVVCYKSRFAYSSPTKMIGLGVASLGIAASLWAGGRTPVFKLRLNIKSTSEGWQEEQTAAEPLVFNKRVGSCWIHRGVAYRPSNAKEISHTRVICNQQLGPRQAGSTGNNSLPEREGPERMGGEAITAEHQKRQEKLWSRPP